MGCTQKYGVVTIYLTLHVLIGGDAITFVQKEHTKYPPQKTRTLNPSLLTGPTGSQELTSQVQVRSPTEL